jgi:hypothetical protein
VLAGAFFVFRPIATHSLIHGLIHRSRALSPAEIARVGIANAAAISPLRGRIVAVAESQVGYRTDPPSTYCNKYSAYWISGASDCGNGNLDEEWCADFAAWVWQKAGVLVVYQYINGDSRCRLDSSDRGWIVTSTRRRSASRLRPCLLRTLVAFLVSGITSAFWALATPSLGRGQDASASSIIPLAPGVR